MAILDDLKGILSPAEYEKIAGNAAMKTKLEKGEELYGYYVGADDPPPAAAPAAGDPPPAARATPPSLDLSGIERVLDARLSKLDERIDARLNTVVTEKGNELVNNAVRIALQRSDELNRIYMEHQANYGEAFDSSKFNEFLEANKDKGFQSIRQGYDAYISPRATEREVEKRVTAKMAEKSGQQVPGTTPAPGTNKTILHFKGRTAAAGDGATTGAQRAAALLDRRAAKAS
jgi:hypothetical protein